MANWDRKFSNGSFFNNWNGRLVYNVNSQSIANNTSNISLTLQAFSDSGAYTQSGAWDARIYINGNQVARSTPSVYVANSPVTLTSYSGDVGHNADGTLTITLGDYINAPVNEMVYGTLSWTLPTIPRYANFTSLTATNITDVGFTANFSVDATCDRYAISTDNGSTYGAWVNGDFTSRSISIGGNLPSDTAIQWKVKVRRKDSQLETTSGTQTATTLPQSNFAVWSII